MKNYDFVTLAKFTSPERANLIKALLDSAGIDNQLLNETSMQVLPHIPNAIQLVVRAEDYDRAKAFLEAKFDNGEFMTEAKSIKD